MATSVPVCAHAHCMRACKFHIVLQLVKHMKYIIQNLFELNFDIAK